MPSDPLAGISGELARRTRGIAGAATEAGQATELRAKLRQATVTAWVPYAAGPPVQPAGVTVDVFGAAIIPVLGGVELAVDDSVWLISNGRGRWLCLGRIDFAGQPAPWGQPWGIINRAQVTSNPGAFSAVTDLPGASVTFTAVAGRRYLITASVLFVVATASAGPSLQIYRGATQIQNSAWPNTVPAGDLATLTATIDDAGFVAGSVTYKLRGTRQSGTGTLNTSIVSDRPDWILVQDIGPA